MYEIAILIFIIIDQATKFLTKSILEPIGTIPVIGGFFNFTYVENRGAAFGMLQGRQWFFVIIGLLVIIAGLFFIHKKNIPSPMKLSIALIVSGGVGNMIDRVFRGYVVDFFDFRFIWSYVFNVADIYVVVGTILLCLLIFLEDRREDKNGRNR